MHNYSKNRIVKGCRAWGIKTIRYRLAILLATVIVAGLAAAQFPKISIATSIESLFTRHNKTLGDYYGKYGKHYN